MDVDLAGLLIRATLGPMLIAHGWNKIRGPGGIDGTTQWFRALGLRPARLQAWGAAAMEIAVGTMVLIGAITGIASIAIVGIMVVAAVTDHRGKGYFVFRGGNEYTLTIILVALTLAALGPGLWSLDGLIGIEQAGVGWAAAALALGFCGGAAVLAACYRPAPSETSS